MKKRIKAQAYGESAFDVLYLIAVVCFGIYYLVQGNQSQNATLVLYGSMALVLGIGDSFHLIPRILYHLTSEPSRWNTYLGIGKLITSITMTVFYIMLFYVWKDVYSAISLPSVISILVWGSAILRVILCLFPQNHWIQNSDSGKWAIYRNIPFILLGIVIVLLYAYSAYILHEGFFFMPIAILLSFIFYIPVTLYATTNPKVGMLMLPKTLMYVWIVYMGVQLL